MNKLKGHKKINLLFNKGKTIKHFPFRVIYIEHKEVSWGVSVSKKAFALAVDRNKIKRRLRNIMNEAVKKIPIKFQYSYLVIAKPTMLNNEFKLIKETLFQEFNKIKK